MSARTVLYVGVALFGLMGTPALATGYGHGGYCGGQDKNGCSVSPVTYKSCSADIRGDLKDLKCDVAELVRDIFRGKDNKEIRQDIKEIQADLKEIKFDYATLATLKKSHPKGGHWQGGRWSW